VDCSVDPSPYLAVEFDVELEELLIFLVQIFEEGRPSSIGVFLNAL
jgi:hypothetical protein